VCLSLLYHAPITRAKALAVLRLPTPDRRIAVHHAGANRVAVKRRRNANWLRQTLCSAARCGAVLALSSCAIATSHDGSSVLPMKVGDRLLMSDVQLPPTDSASALALAYALQAALRQSANVRFVTPLAISDALRRMNRPAGATALPDSIAIEVAVREGARYVLSLRVIPTPVSRFVSLTVLEPATGTAIRNYAATVKSADVLYGIDVVAGKLRRDLGDSKADVARAIPLPYATTPSLEALRLLASARAAFGRVQYVDARTLYEGALVLDSGFAAAHAGLAMLDYTYNNTAAADAHMAKALAEPSRLTIRERLLIEATAARGARDWLRAASLHRAYLIRYPDDYDVYASLGYDLMRASSPDAAAVAFDSLKAHRAPGVGDWLNIGQIKRSLGRYGEAREAHAMAIRRDSAVLMRGVANEEIGAVLLALGFADSARMVHAAFLRGTVQDQARAHRSLAYVDLYEGRYASAVEHLQKAIEINSGIPAVTLSEVRDRALLADVLIDLGQLTPARELLLKGAERCLTRPLSPLAVLWTGKPLARLGETALAQKLLDSARARTRVTDRDEQAATLTLAAELQLAANHASDAARTADSALVLSDSTPYLLETRAVALERSGALLQSRSAYVALQAMERGTLEKEGQQKARLAALDIARLDAALGRTAAARRTIGAFMERWPNADANLPMITRLRGRVAALGDGSPTKPQ
jgi:tetratricopeptide (TPR) repeat protein